MYKLASLDVPLLLTPDSLLVIQNVQPLSFQERNVNSNLENEQFSTQFKNQGIFFKDAQ